MPNQQDPTGACEEATLNQLQTRLRRAIVQEQLHCQAISGALRGERQALLDRTTGWAKHPDGWVIDIL